MDRHKSIVWKLFSKVEAPGDTKWVKCSVCKKEFKYSGNTTNLKDHLKRKHEKGLTKLTTAVPEDDDETEVEVEGEVQIPKAQSRQSIKTYFNRGDLYDRGSKTKKELDKLYVEMIAIDMMPYRTSEHEGLIRFVKGLNGKYEIPPQTTLKSTLVPEYYFKLKQKLTMALLQSPYISITTDM